MKPLTIETFNTNMIKVDNSEQKKAGKINYTSVNKTNDLILNLTPENVTQHSRIE